MRICRFVTEDGPKYGLVEADHVLELNGDLFSLLQSDPGSTMPMGKAMNPVGRLDTLQLLAPIVPGKIICVGRNYAAHAAELGNEVPTDPLLFFKPPSAVIGPGAAIELLPETGRVDHEAELAIVIGTQARYVSINEARDVIFGFTCANDVSDRDFQKSDNQWARAKGFDTFCPLGPIIDTAFEPDDVTVSCYVNDELKQQASTANMIFNIPFLISYISRIMTLNPGDVILTGTPEGVSQIHDGDTVTIEIDGLGQLTNSVKAID